MANNSIAQAKPSQVSIRNSVPASRPAAGRIEHRERRGRGDGAHRPQAPGPESQDDCGESAHTYFTATISYVRVPFGATTSTMSPCDLPTSARAIGEETADPAALDVGLGVADDLVDDFVAAVLVFQLERGAEDDLAAGRQCV